MKNIKHVVLVSALLSVSVVTHAEKVYESVDSKGEVEFSDQPSKNAQQIDVQPNVVHVVPVDDAASPATRNVNAGQPNTNRGTNTVEHDAGYSPRRAEADRLRRERERNRVNTEHRSGEMRNSAGTRAVEGGGHRGGRR